MIVVNINISSVCIWLMMFSSSLAPLKPEPLLIVVGCSRLERGVIREGALPPLSYLFPLSRTQVIACKPRYCVRRELLEGYEVLIYQLVYSVPILNIKNLL